MQGAVNYMAGTVRIRISARYPERVINICAQSGIEFWDLERRKDGTAVMTVYIQGYRRLREISRKSGLFNIKIEKRKGVPFLLWRIRKRYVLIFGLILCFAALITSSFFVWQIDIEGNEKVSSSEILAAMRKYGVSIGTCTLTIQNDYISNKVLLEIPELSWMTINTHGSRARVIVREKRPIPEIIDYTVPTSVYSSKAGIITKIIVLRGTPQVTVGDTVFEGDLLVSSQVGSVASGDRYVRADAEIWARTWYNMSESMPLSCTRKQYTGSETTRVAIILGKKRINLYFSGGNPYEDYDKITLYDNITAFDGSALPVTVVKETFTEYEEVSAMITAESAGKVLEARLTERLNAEIGDGSVESVNFEYSVENGVLTVTMSAECVEEITTLRELSADEIIYEEELPDAPQE